MGNSRLAFSILLSFVLLNALLIQATPEAIRDDDERFLAQSSGKASTSTTTSAPESMLRKLAEAEEYGSNAANPSQASETTTTTQKPRALQQESSSTPFPYEDQNLKAPSSSFQQLDGAAAKQDEVQGDAQLAESGSNDRQLHKRCCGALRCACGGLGLGGIGGGYGAGYGAGGLAGAQTTSYVAAAPLVAAAPVAAAAPAQKGVPAATYRSGKY